MHFATTFETTQITFMSYNNVLITTLNNNNILLLSFEIDTKLKLSTNNYGSIKIIY